MAGQWSLSRFCMALTSILSRLRTDILPNDTQTRSVLKEVKSFMLFVYTIMFFFLYAMLSGWLPIKFEQGVKKNSARQFYIIIIGLDREHLLVNSSIAT